MTVSFLKYFYTNDFDNKVILKGNNRSYMVGEIKPIISKKIDFLRSVEDKNIIIASNDNFEFFINFMACVFSNKEVTLVNDTQKMKSFGGFILNNQARENENLIFNTIDENEVIINIFTSGSSGENKCIKKSLENLIQEANDLISEIDLKNAKSVISTTTFNYLFGLTFYLMLPLNSGLCIDLERINYPEDIKGENLLLVTTPSFLEKMNKYSENINLKLEKIITAGAKLKKEEFNYALNISNSVTEIYGSTESGIIAHRESPNSNLKLFNNVEIIFDENTFIKTNYSIENINKSGDLIKPIENREIELLGRVDRILKVYEKRISAEELEQKLEEHKFVKEAYCLNYEDKIASMISLTNEGFEFVLNNDILQIKKELKMYLKEFFEIVPQKFKFIDELPKTQRGKVDRNKILEVFDINMSYPLILKREIKENFANFKVYFYKHCDFFKGHFEGFPILAGVVQLLFASILTKATFGVECSIGQIKRIKFKNIIRPDEIIELKIEKVKENFVFTYYNREKIFSSGVLPTKNIFKG